MDDQGIVYVIDDDEMVRKGLEILIRTAGLDVKTFPSARSFLSDCLPDRPACLVLDINMPGMTGLELQDRLAAANRANPIIFLTGFGNVPASVKAMRAGAVDFLEKPVEDEVLLEAIRRAIQTDTDRLGRSRQEEALRRRYGSLTRRERDVFQLVTAGLLNKQVAFQLGIAEKTVKVHRARAMQKMGVASLAELVRLSERLK